MSKYIKKDENGFYVFDEIEFLKTLPTGLEYFAVDKETEQIYNLGFNYKEKMEKQIADLEAKLAESKEQCRECKHLNKKIELNIKNKLMTEIQQLEQQLAEKETRIAELEDKDWYEATIKQLEEQNDRLIKQLAEKDEQIKNLRIDLKDWQDLEEKVSTKYDKVVEQLAEKEEENQELLNSIQIKDLSNINFIQVNDDVVRFSESGVIYEYNKKDNTICKIVDKIYQDKISFCIEKLVNIQKYISDNPVGAEQECFSREINEYIDNQIEELKKEMK